MHIDQIQVCSEYLQGIRSVLLESVDRLNKMDDKSPIQTAIAYSLKQCSKYIDFYRIHYVLNFDTDYIYQYFIASFLQVHFFHPY